MEKVQFCPACKARYDNSVEACFNCYYPVLKPIKSRPKKSQKLGSLKELRAYNKKILRSREWTKTHPVSIKMYHKAYRLAHLEFQKTYNRINRKRISVYNEMYYLTHLEHIKARKRAHYLMSKEIRRRDELSKTY